MSIRTYLHAYFKRRDDLEIRGIESQWIEISNDRKRILFTQHKPNSSDMQE